MNEARCPLVREIDPKFRSGNAVPVERASITIDEWQRIRAALEAAEEMADWLAVDPEPMECVQCYRAATRGS